MTIESICKQRKIPFAHSKKVVYENYCYSLTVALPFAPPIRPKLTDSFWDDYIKAKIRYEKKRTTFASKIVQLVNSDAYKINTNSVTHYFETQEQLETALSELSLTKYLIIRVTAAPTPKINDLMKDSPKTEFRKSLYFGKYAYRVSLKNAWGETRAELLTYLSNFFSNGDIEQETVNVNTASGHVSYDLYGLSFDEERACYRNSNHVYIRDEEDVFLLRLGLNHLIDGVTKIELLSK